MLIHSGGGNISACYQTARFFARYVDDWEALIPAYAASGATLISLGASTLTMSDIAQMGPIDPQVKSKRPQRFFDLERQSPLEAFQAMKYLRQFALESLDATMAFLMLPEHDVNPHLALETATKFAAMIVDPVLAKIEPYDLGAFTRDSNLAMSYCHRIAQPENQSKKTQRLARYKALVEEYPAHEFIVDIDEAIELGFNANLPSDSLESTFEPLRGALSKVEVCIGLLPYKEGEPTDDTG